MSDIIRNIDRELVYLTRADPVELKQISEKTGINVELIQKSIKNIEKTNINLPRENKTRSEQMEMDIKLISDPDTVKNFQAITDELNKIDAVKVTGLKEDSCGGFFRALKEEESQKLILIYQTILDTYGGMINSLYVTLLEQIGNMSKVCKTEKQYNDLKKLLFSAQKVLITKDQLNEMCQPLITSAVDAKVCPTCPTCPTCPSCATCPKCKKSWFGLYKCSGVTEGFYGGSCSSDNNVLLFIILLVAFFYLMKK
jgi:hypothetical protein